MTTKKQRTIKDEFVRDAIERLKECATESKGDAEGPHANADQILTEVFRHLGRDDVAEVFETVHKWYA